MIGDTITSISNGPNLGIYVASVVGEDSVIIKDNVINVTGCASSSGSWALVSGIEIQNGNAKIHHNQITTNNVNDYDDNAYMYGISYAQWMYGTRSFDIQDNTIYTDGKYAISVIDATNLDVVNNTLFAHELEGDAAVNPGDCTEANIQDNLSENINISNIVTQDNFYHFFDEDGILRDDVTSDHLIFQGEFSDLIPYIALDRPITITGDDAVLNDMAFIIASDDVTLDSLTLVANSDLGNLIDIAGQDVVISNTNISYILGDVSGSAINVYPDAHGVQILNDSIYFESHITDDEDITTAINLEGVEDAIIDGNSIVASIPGLYVSTYDYTYFTMGLCNVNPIRLYEVETTEITNNKVDVVVNSFDSAYPTVQALYIVGSSDILVQGNDINMVDTLTTAGTPIYLYAVECGFSEEIEFIENNLNISTTGGKSGTGSVYAIQVPATEATFIRNNITCECNSPAIGICAPYGFGPANDLIIKENTFDITGLATQSSDFALISAIEIQTGYATIYNDTINVHNKGGYDDSYPVSGVSAIQYSAKTLSFDIQGNKINVPDGKYAVDIRYAPSETTVTGNQLDAHELKGDNAVNPGNSVEATIEGNLPKDIGNIVTPDNFYSFFDEGGSLLDDVTSDELIFKGEFSNANNELVPFITIDRPITITGDIDTETGDKNAVLKNIALSITGNDVTVTGFTLNENDADFTANGGAAIYVSGSYVTLDSVSVTYNAPSEVDAKAICANDADNFALINSEIIFTGTNPGENHYRGLEVRDCDGAVIDNDTISATFPAVPVDWSSGGNIAQDLVLAVGIQGGDDVEFTNNRINVNTNGGISTYPTIDAIMVYSTNDILIKGNNIRHFDTTAEDNPRYYYTLDIYSTTGTVEANNIIVNTTTTAGDERAGSAFPIQLNGPFKVTVKDNNVTGISKGPVAGIYASNWGGEANLTVENNNIDVTGYATTSNYALVAGIEAEIDTLRAYNNTITVENVADYDDANQVIGVGIGTSWFWGDAYADITGNTVTADGKYAVYYAKAAKSNVTENTLYAQELTGDAAVYIASGSENTVEKNVPVTLKEDGENPDPAPLPEDIDLSGLTYSRTLTAPGDAEGSGDTQIDGKPANLFTICLPFTPETGDAVKYYTLSSVIGEILDFDEVTSPVANTPYLVALSGTDNFTESCTKLEVSSMAINSTTIDGYTFNGTFTGMTNEDAQGKYVLQSNNKWGKVTAEDSETFIPPFRAFIEGPVDGASQLSGSIDGSATGIKYIRTQNTDGTEQYFDLSGRRIAKPTTKGIYIRNGKKEVLK